MATHSRRLDICKIRAEYLGPMLLGYFLEDGFLKIWLSEAEKAHLQRIGHAHTPKPGRFIVEATDILADLFAEAAKRAGFSNALEDWNFGCEPQISTVLIWDPDRIEFSKIA